MLSEHARQRKLAGLPLTPGGAALLEERRGQLLEIIESPIEVLEAATVGNGGRMKVKAKVLEADTRNRNNRVYPLEVVTREVGRFAERIAAGTAYASGDHPADGRTSLDNVAGLWTKVELRGKEVFAEATLLGTPKGRALQEVLRVAKTIPVSARGYGATRAAQWEGQPVDVVEDAYQLEAVDFVLNVQGFADARATAVHEEKGAGAMQQFTMEEIRSRRLAGLPPLTEAVTDRPLTGLIPRLAAAVAASLNPVGVHDLTIISFDRDAVYLVLDGKTMKVPYTVSAEGAITLGVPVPVVAPGGIAEEQRQSRERVLAGLPPLTEEGTRRGTRAREIPRDLPLGSRVRRAVIAWDVVEGHLEGHGSDADLAVVAMSEALGRPFSEITKAVSAAIRAKFNPTGNADVYVMELFADRVILQKDGKLFELEYTIDDETGEAALGTAQEVRIQYEPVKTETTETVQAAAGPALTEQEVFRQQVLAGVR